MATAALIGGALLVSACAVAGVAGSGMSVHNEVSQSVSAAKVAIGKTLSVFSLSSFSSFVFSYRSSSSIS